MAMLEVNNLKTRDGVVKAVDGVSFSLEAGETLGGVGERQERDGAPDHAAQPRAAGLLPGG